jgi:uncharacterized protein
MLTSRYILLRTFRADGSGVDTPLWFGPVPDGIAFRTNTDSPKVRRLAARPAVELRPCNWRGQITGPEVLTGSAHLLNRCESLAAERPLRKRYGWMWNVVPVLPLKVNKGHKGQSLRDRWRYATAKELWPTSSIVVVTFDGPAE